MITKRQWEQVQRECLEVILSTPEEGPNEAGRGAEWHDNSVTFFINNEPVIVTCVHTARRFALMQVGAGLAAH